MSENIVNAEYVTTLERTPEVIASEIRYIEESTSKVVLSAAVEIGKRLTEAKEKVNHGEWEDWCRDNLNYSKSWAEKLMKISTEYGDEKSPYFLAISKTDTCPLLTISKAIRLLRVPENEVENFVENENLNDMTVKELEEKIKLLQEKEEAKEAELAEAAEESEKAEAHIQKLEEQLKNLRDSKNKEISEVRMQNVDYASEISNLKEQLQAQKSNVEETEKLKKAEAEAQAELEKIKAQLQAAEADKQSAIEEAVKKASAGSDPEFIKFKIAVDSIQVEFQKALNIASQKDAETKEKWEKALKGVLEATIGQL